MIDSDSSNTASIVFETPLSTTIDNCYILDGIFTNSTVTLTHCYNAAGTWVTEDAKTALNIDGTWAYDDDDDKTKPFVLHLLNTDNAYVFIDNTLDYDTTVNPHVGVPFNLVPIGQNNTKEITYSSTTATFSPTNTNSETVTFTGTGPHNFTVTQPEDTSNFVDLIDKTFIWNVIVDNEVKFAITQQTSSIVDDEVLLMITTRSTGPVKFSSNTSVVFTNDTSQTGATVKATSPGSAIITVIQFEQGQYAESTDSFTLNSLIGNEVKFAITQQTSSYVDEEVFLMIDTDSTGAVQFSSTGTPVVFTTSQNGATVKATSPGSAIITVTQFEQTPYAESTASFTLDVLLSSLLIYESIDDENKLAQVIGIYSPTQDLVIPPTTILEGNEYTVMGIADEAFIGKLSGTIEFPSTLHTIGNSAFQGCALTGNLSLPSSVTSIGKSAFLGCGFSGTLTLPPLLEVLEEGVFDRCSFTSLAPPTNLRSIGAYAFYDNPLFVYDFTQCEQLFYIDSTAFNTSGRYEFLDINVYVTAFTYERIKNFPFPKYVKLHTGVPVSNICFVAGTMVKTDQGKLPIQSLTRKNTLRGQPIQVTKTKHDDPYLVKIQAYAFDNVPTQDTYMSLNHRVYFNHDRVKARDLVNGETVTLVDYTGEPLYNVLVKAHTHMEVHGMIVETLDPTSVIALLYTSKLSPNQKTFLVEKMNRQTEYEDLVIHLKRNQ